MPDLKMIVLLRNPIHRIISHMKHDAVMRVKAYKDGNYHQIPELCLLAELEIIETFCIDMINSWDVYLECMHKHIKHEIHGDGSLGELKFKKCTHCTLHHTHLFNLLY